MALTRRQKEAIDNAVKRIKSLNANDPEAAHGNSDKVLCDLLIVLGAGEVVDARNELIDRCGWWSYA
jgi:hypothetical protein